MNILFITINSFSYIPVMRYIITHLQKSNDIELIECYISGNYKFEGISINYIMEFNSNLEFQNQKTWFKIKKYLFSFYEIFTFILLKKDIVIYAQDYEIVLIATFFKRVFFWREVKIIYHQFEVINYDTRIRKLLKFGNPEVVIFPEVNRFVYFKEYTKSKASSLIFPNTCRTNFDIILSDSSVLLYEIGKRKVVGHIGNIGSDHFIDVLVKLLEFADESQFYFILIGNYDFKVNEILDKFKKKSNVKILNSVPHSQISEIYEIIDIGLIMYKPIDVNYDFCAPNKLYEYWSYGVPVFAHRLKGLTSLFENNVYGELFDFYDKDIHFEIIDKMSERNKNNSIKDVFFAEYDIENFLPLLNEKLKNKKYDEK
jgi:glycosyltransferase involved in cell wall biosynthesis